MKKLLAVSFLVCLALGRSGSPAYAKNAQNKDWASEIARAAAVVQGDFWAKLDRDYPLLCDIEVYESEFTGVGVVLMDSAGIAKKLIFDREARLVFEGMSVPAKVRRAAMRENGIEAAEAKTLANRELAVRPARTAERIEVEKTAPEKHARNRNKALPGGKAAVKHDTRRKAARPAMAVNKARNVKSAAAPSAAVKSGKSARPDTLVLSIARQADFLKRLERIGDYGKDHLYDIRPLFKGKLVGVLLLEPDGFVKQLVFDKETMKVFFGQYIIPRKATRAAIRKYGILVSDARVLAENLAALRAEGRRRA
jgi:hypothetical protein